MTLFVLIALLMGLVLVVMGVQRYRQAPAQAVGLFVGALLLNAWWLILFAMVLFKTTVLKQDT